MKFSVYFKYTKKGMRFLKMIVVAVLGILFAGFACTGMSIVGACSFVKSHDWHHAAGAGLYALGAVLFIGWVFSMGY